MSTEPDQQTVRELATEHILDSGRQVDDIGADVVGHFGPGVLTKRERNAWCNAIRKAIRTATITVSWPDELPNADRAYPNDRSPWSEWLVQQLHLHGWLASDLAGASAGVFDTKQVSRWLWSWDIPAPRVVALVAKICDTSVIEALHAAEHGAMIDAVLEDAARLAPTTGSDLAPALVSDRDAEHLLKQVAFLTRDGALRTVMTDTESASGVALVCTSPDHPEGWEHHVRECCDEEAVEMWHESAAAFHVAATTAIPALLGERDQLRARLVALSAELTAANVDNAVVARQRAELRARVRELEAAQDGRPGDVQAVRAVVDAAGKLSIPQFEAMPELAEALNALLVQFEEHIKVIDDAESLARLAKPAATAVREQYAPHPAALAAYEAKAKR